MQNLQKKLNILTENRKSRMALEKREFPSESGNVDTGLLEKVLLDPIFILK